ncbi:MAG: tRNA (adenosine(37)-N6)-threonylcarbamoyltransferase complex ATPase subunit type 1 TsaE, partial [Deltaproteobacteria bacterium]
MRTGDLVAATVEETEALGEALGRAAEGRELIGLVGDLGAGKTCLVRGL